MLRVLKSIFLRDPFVFVLAALLALALGTAAPQARASDAHYGQGLLWRVQKEGGPVSYVLGTFHSTDARLRDLDPAVDQALNQSRLAVFELIDSAAGNAEMAAAMRLPAGRRLEDILGPRLYQRTMEAVAPLGVPEAALQQLKPWGLNVFLIFPPVELARLAQGEPVFDNWLQAEARRRGKTVEALETHEEQIEIFDGMSEAEQAAMVADMVNDYADINGHFNRMFRAYLKGDIGVLMAEANDMSGVASPAAAERLKNRLIDDRNRIMAARIAPLLRDGGAFIAVGAAHLPGAEGVLARLESRGYTVSRVN